MEILKVKNLKFKYPAMEEETLKNISLTVNKGDFLTVCGKSGSGKSTLLRLLKPAIAPFGESHGNIYCLEKQLSELSFREQSETLGFVSQNPENQVVTDRVWHELAFGAESLGISAQEIKLRIAEMATFFGIQGWIHKNVVELSGGQKQILNLASVMIMRPQILILDEPTAQLDPIAAQNFLEILAKINRELGTTIIIAEHRLETVFSFSNRVVVMENGEIIADSSPREIGKILKEKQNDMQIALPTATRVYLSVENDNISPVTICEGREWLEAFLLKDNTSKEGKKVAEKTDRGKAVIEIKNAWFRYEKNLPDILRGLSLKLYKGEICAVVGGNGTGKTTLISLLGGIKKAYRGTVKVNSKEEIIGTLPQNPQLIFLKNTVKLDLLTSLENLAISEEEKKLKINDVVRLCKIESILERHPYDVSGGELQRAALAKILLLNPTILLIDEPTKGMDSHFKLKFGEILKALKKNGTTIVMVSHDVEFCAKYADRCAMIFDGEVVSEGGPREFFNNNVFYTTTAVHMARGIIPDVVITEDIVKFVKDGTRGEDK